MLPSIIVTGTHSTGKSTLIDNLMSWLVTKVCPVLERDVPEPAVVGLIDNIVRKLKEEKGYGLYKEGTEKMQLALMARYLEEWEKNKSKLRVCDRFFSDQYAYAAANGCWQEVLDLIIGIYKKLQNEVTIMFYIPIEFSIVGDEFRDQDEEYRRQVDERFYEFFNIVKPVNCYILSGPAEKRIFYAKRYIVQEFGKFVKEEDYASLLHYPD